MKIWLSPYSLAPEASLNAVDTGQSREGVLLRIEFDQVGIGYADCHPWDIFGDPSWRDQVQSLRDDHPLPLISRSLELAQWDATFRQQEKSLFPEAPLLKSHYLLTNPAQFSLSLLEQLVDQDYEIVKLKMGRNWDEDLEFLRRLSSIMPEKLKVRLDFNGRATPSLLTHWLETLGDGFLEHLDFLEDPFAYEVSEWLEFKSRWNIPLACDQYLSRESDLSGADLLVIKPNRLSGDDLDHYARLWGEKRWIFTHQMDHPVGRMMALGYAMNFYRTNPEKEEIGGFESSRLYQETVFDEHIFQEGALQLGTDGTGVGFETSLKELPWEPL